MYPKVLLDLDIPDNPFLSAVYFRLGGWDILMDGYYN